MNGEIKTPPISKSLERLIGKIAKENGYKDYAVEVKALNSGGGNYMGDLFAIDVLEKGKDTLSLFAKASNTSPQARAHIPTGAIYEREVFAYTDLVDAFEALQTKHRVPDEQRFKFAKYYGSDLTELEEVLVLENLAKEGYTMYDRCRSMDWEYAKAALEELAKYHALSFALEIEEPAAFERLVRSKKEFFVNREGPKGDGFRQYAEEMIGMALRALEPSYVESVKKFSEGFEEFWPRQLQPLTKQSVLVHGDYRISNQMVKYEEGVLASIIPLDYQTIFYGSPINDVIYLLVTGTDEAFRRQHYEAYRQHYHDSLRRALASLSHDVDEVYPRELFEKHMKDKLLYGLGIAIYLLPIVMVEADAAPKISDMVEGPQEGRIPGNAMYAKRLNGIVADLKRWGALDAAQ